MSLPFDTFKLSGVSKVAGITAALYVTLLLLPGLTQAQDTANRLQPSEAYMSAMAPYNAARAQPNDLTEADIAALKIGMAQASRDCLATGATTTTYDQDAKQLFALGQLCILGQQFEPARASLVNYLSLPQPPERETALLLLVRALLGLNEPGSAEAQIYSCCETILTTAEFTLPWMR